MNRNRVLLPLGGLAEATDTLSDFPLRHSLIPEAESLGIPFRSFNYHSHRVVYRVDESASTVYIIRVCHGARRELSDRDVDPS